MEKILNFFTIIAWIFGILSTFLLFIGIYLGITYSGSMTELMDKAKGKKRTYNITWALIISIVCWAFIIVFH